MATAQFPPQAVRDTQNPNAPLSQDGVQLESALSRLLRRRNALSLLRCVSRVLLPAVILGAFGVLAYRFYLLDGQAWMTAALLSVALLIGVGAGISQRSNSYQVAVETDVKLGLRDLLASALAFVRPQSGTAHATSFVPVLVRDAAQVAAKIDAKTVYPLRFDRVLQVLAVSSILLGAFVWMPDNDRFLSKEQKQVNFHLKVAGQKLEKAAKAIQNKPQLRSDLRAQINARRMEALAKRMQSGRMTPKKALLGLGALKRDLARAADKTSQPVGQTDFQRLREALKNGSFQSETAQKMQQDLQQNRDKDAADKLDKLADQLQNPNASPSEREKTAKDLETAANALRQQKDAQSQNAARQLEQAARDLRQNGQNQQSQQQQGQQGSQQQNGQQAGQQKSQNGQQQSGQQGQQKSGQNGQSQQQNGSQSGSSGSASDEMRRMAEGLRNNSNSGDQAARDMMKRIQEAENGASGGQNGQQQSGQNGQSGQQQNGQNGQGKNGKMGQGQGGKNGQNGSGQSGQMGQGQGGDGRKSVMPGRDLMPTDPTQGGGGAGLGPRNNIKGGQGSGGGVSKMRAQKSNDDRRWGDVWSDRLPATQKKSSQIKGKMGSDGESERLETRGEARGGAAKTPYYDVYESYKRDAEDAIARENVPPAYKGQVKNYFESLDPNKG